MKSVAMIAYFFPPEGSAGSYRPLRFVRHLAGNGWHTSVIAAHPHRYERYDPDLLSCVPSDTEVVRVRARDPWQAFQALRGKRMDEKLSVAPVEVAERVRASHQRPFRSRIREAVRTVEASYYLPDMARPWIRPAVEATVELCRRKQTSVIWATAGPVSAWVVAHQASQRTGVPFVLDLRDPYGLDYYESEARQSARSKHRYRRTLYQLFKAAQAVVMMFDTLAECYIRAYRRALDASKVHLIPNGYDGAIEDFAAPEGNKCLVLYTGTLATYRYDTLLQSLHSLKRTDPASASRLHFLFVGDYMEHLEHEARALGLSDMVETTGPKPLAQIVRAQRNAHALLILGREPERKGHELVAGAKLFDYMKARRAIIGLLPRDEARKILCRVGVTTVADANSPTEIIAVLRQLLDAWASGMLASLLPDAAACDVFSAEQQTAALVRALESMPAAQPFVPGSVEVPLSLRDQIQLQTETGDV